MEIKSEIRCCMGCLKDEKEIPVENNNDDNITNIFNLLIQGETNEPLLPSITLCSICKDSLIFIIKFQKQCLESIDSLRTKLEFKPEVIFIKEEIDFDKILEDDSVQNIEKQNTDSSSDENDDGQLGSDDKTSDEESEDEVKIEVQNDPKPRKYKTTVKKRHYCQQCDCSYVNRKLLTNHVKHRHQGGLTCKFCRDVFLDKEEFEKHVKEEEAKPRPDKRVCCELCGYTTKFKGSLKYHITKFHTLDQPKLICDVCGKSYLFRGQFKDHFISSHMEKQLQCNECGKKFALNYLLKKHIYDYHTTEGRTALIKCKYCPKMKTRVGMEYHIRSHSNKKFVCDVCSKVFNRSRALKNHMQTHNPDRTKVQRRTTKKINKSDSTLKDKSWRSIVECNECGITCKSKIELTQHQLLTHLDKETLEKRYVSCKFCEEKLRPGSLQMHIIRKHTNFRKLKCSQCDKTFHNNRDVMKHMNTHTGERPYQCDLCPKNYTQDGPLRNHYKNVHGMKYTSLNPCSN